MATYTPKPPRIISGPVDGFPIQEAAGQTYRAGEFLTPTAGPDIFSKAGTGATLVSAGKLVIAAKHAQNLSATGKNEAIEIVPDATKIRICATGAAATAANTATGTQYGVTTTTVNGVPIHTLDLTNTTNLALKIIRFSQSSDNGFVGDTNVFVDAEFLPAVTL